MDKKELQIKDAQYRKGLSIAFFNATNSAISLVCAEEKLRWGEGEMISNVRKFRDLFLEDHKEYYATVIANVSPSYDPVKTIEKINQSTSVEDLKTRWMMLSEDERHDKDIRKAVNDIKQKYVKA